ncbi:MAG TPA: hypothetical protein VJZ32_13320 [Candidatus Bathyarchaeia archaeon]|nr:hypothetical protein [Candidatus Bathyarchaeia archaeon]
MKSTLPVVLALLFALSAIIIVGALSFVSASPLASTSPIIPEFPLAITAAAVVALVIAGAVVAFKHGLIKIHEVKTDNNPMISTDNNPLTVHPEWFCRYCGAEIAFSGQYCDKCGMHLT